MIHTAKLTDDNIQSVEVECDALAKLHSAGFPFDAEETYSVVSVKGGNTGPKKEDGYIVQKGQSLRVPISLADAVEDSCELWVCTCPSYLYHTLRDIDDAGVGPEELDYCKHIENIDKTVRARQDKNQETL